MVQPLSPNNARPGPSPAGRQPAADANANVQGERDVAALYYARPGVFRGISRTTFANLLIALVWLNCTSIFLYHLTASGFFQVLGNVVAVGTVLICIAICGTGPKFHGSKVFGALLAIDLASSYALNFSRTDPVDTLKFFEIFAIFGAARECAGSLKVNKFVYGLTVLPLILIAAGGSRIIYDKDSWSFFYNTNTAALFYTALLFVFSISNPRYKLAAQICVCSLSGKVGVLLATLTAMIVSGVIRLRASTLLIALGGLAAGGIMIFLGILDRQISVVSNFLSDLRSMGLSGIAAADFGDLYKLRGGDLSAYFRIIHWTEILQHYIAGGPETWLFGYGGGYTVISTRLKLVPHNDYLKSLAEFGVFALLAFLTLVIKASFGIRDRVQRSLFLVVAFYFGTENLLSNFASMALLFGFAGLVYESRSRPLS